MKNITLALIAIVVLCVAGASRSGPIAVFQPPSPESDSTYALVDLIAQATDSVVKEDSIEASTPVLVPFQRSIEHAAVKERLPASLLAAIVQTESRFKQFATRTEPPYKNKRVVQQGARTWSKAHGGLPTYYTELDDRSRSYGLGQPMGQTARELKYDAQYLATLYLPDSNLRVTAKKFRLLLDRYHGDTLSAISAYNQGNNRKAHGHFVNAGYVYRVSLAWAAYDRAFSKRTLIHENRLKQGDIGPRRSGPALDRAERLPDTTEGGLLAIGNSSRHNDRHGPPRSGPTIGAGDESLRRPDRDPTDNSRRAQQTAALVTAAATLLSAGLYLAFGLSRDRPGHRDRDLRSPERFVLAKSRAKPASSIRTPFLRRAAARREAHLARRRDNGA